MRAERSGSCARVEGRWSTAAVLKFIIHVDRRLALRMVVLCTIKYPAVLPRFEQSPVLIGAHYK